MRLTTFAAASLGCIVSISASMQRPGYEGVKLNLNQHGLPSTITAERQNLIKRSPKGGSITGGIVQFQKLQANYEKYKLDAERHTHPQRKKNAENSRDDWDYRVKAFTNLEQAKDVAKTYGENQKYDHQTAWLARVEELKARKKNIKQARASGNYN